jgi:hypothetical protein
VVQSKPDAGIHRSEEVHFRTVRDALAKAMPGERILVRDEVIEEPLPLLDGKLGREVTLEADPLLGKPVVWKAPANQKDNSQLVVLRDVADFHLRGFVFDGDQRVEDLVTIYGNCPGTTLEWLQLRGFTRSAVHFMTCAGETDRPITLREVRAISAKETQAAILFHDPRQQAHQACQYVLVDKCRFEGPYKAGVEVNSSIADVELTHNRFFNMPDAIVYQKKVPRFRIHLTLTANTFSQIRRTGLHFAAMPLTDNNSQVVLKNNLFAQTAVLAHVDEIPAPPPATKACWIWLDEGDPPKSAPAGEAFFRATFTNQNAAWQAASLEVAADDSYTVWLNGIELGKGQMSRRVMSHDVTHLLRPNRNFVAVQARNKNGPAGLLLQLRVSSNGKAAPVLISDGTWKVAKTGPTGWQSAGFEDKAWASAKVLMPYNKPNGPAAWANLTWDSKVDELFRGGAEPLLPLPVGNVRDRLSGKGNLDLGATVVDFALPQPPNLDNDAEFLRYSPSSPLFTAGHENRPVGVPPVQ